VDRTADAGGLEGKPIRAYPKTSTLFTFHVTYMKVKIKRIDKELPLPVYETEGSVGFDLICRKDTTVEPFQIALIPANVIVETPPGYALMVALRSSTPKKFGLLMPHGIGIIDPDYCGPEDEVLIQIYNFRSEPVKIKRGDKIAQGIFIRVNRATWSEVDIVGKETRGGFGSTDKT